MGRKEGWSRGRERKACSSRGNAGCRCVEAAAAAAGVLVLVFPVYMYVYVNIKDDKVHTHIDVMMIMLFLGGQDVDKTFHASPACSPSSGSTQSYKAYLISLWHGCDGAKKGVIKRSTPTRNSICCVLHTQNHTHKEHKQSNLLLKFSSFLPIFIGRLKSSFHWAFINLIIIVY